MFPKGTIYKYGDPRHGEKVLRLSLAARFFYQTVRGVSAGVIAYIVIFFMFTYGPIIQGEINFRLTGGAKPESYESLVKKAEAETTVQVQEEARELGVNPYFSLVVPKIEAKANIIANVDAGSEKEYEEALSHGVAHAQGTYFPGQGRRIYLFSHSTNSQWNLARYNAVFYLLRKLEKGDKIVVFFADKKYIYEVTEKHVVDAADTEWIGGESEGEELVLQTCDPPGTTWRRLIVVAKPVNK